MTSMARGLRVLDAVLEHGEVSVEALAHDLRMPVSTVYRYLRDLRNGGFVAEASGQYHAGDRLKGAGLVGALPTPTELRRLTRPALELLEAETGETAILAIRNGARAFCLDQVESRHAVNLAFRIGQELPLHAGAGSRVLLAYAPPPIVEEVLAGLTAFTPSTVDAAHLPRRLESIRQSGLATSRGEFVPGAVAVACPVLRNDTCICSLTVASTTHRGNAAWQRRAKDSLRTARRHVESLI
jgi:DNA-binding IclR family transcriptional regulator